MLPNLRARTTPKSNKNSVDQADHTMARIWLTYKTRMHSEARYKNYALVSHLALTWYAFLSIVFSIYQENISEHLGSSGANQASLVISVLTFGLSLIIYGFRFEDNARTHRDCYLRMQSVYQSSDADHDKLDQYRKLLDHYPNHSNRDYQRLLLDGWKSGRPLTDTSGNNIKFEGIDAFREYAFIALNYILLAMIFIVPPIAIAKWIWF